MLLVSAPVVVLQSTEDIQDALKDLLDGGKELVHLITTK